MTASMQANNVFEMAHESGGRLLIMLFPDADTSGSGQTGRRERSTKHALHSCACVCMHASEAPSVVVIDMDTARDSSCWSYLSVTCSVSFCDRHQHCQRQFLLVPPVSDMLRLFL